MKTKKAYRVGDQVKIKKKSTKKTDIRNMKGTVTHVYDRFIVVDNGKFRESFLYADMMTGDIRIEEVGA